MFMGGKMMNKWLFYAIISCAWGVFCLEVRSQGCDELCAFYKDKRKIPHVLAFLDTLAHAEGTAGPDGYLRMYGRGHIFVPNLQQHPHVVRCFKLGGREICSSAAGKYQFLSKTWDDIVVKLGLNDFGPVNQDIGAIYLIHDAGALRDVETKNIRAALTKVRHIWASLPGAPYGQPTKSFEELLRVFEERLAFYKRRTLYV